VRLVLKTLPREAEMGNSAQSTVLQSLAPKWTMAYCVDLLAEGAVLGLSSADGRYVTGWRKNCRSLAVDWQVLSKSIGVGCYESWSKSIGDDWSSIWSRLLSTSIIVNSRATGYRFCS